MGRAEELLPGLWRVRDTCNVYALCSPTGTASVDFGSGRAVGALAEAGLPPIADVLATHHHRDQLQGLAGLEDPPRVWAPESELHLVGEGLDAHWQSRELLTNYNMREDRFSLREPLPVAGPLRDYDQVAFAGFELEVVPTPGHTTGSITLLTTVGGERVAFVGDLLGARGTLPSLAATQWSYDGAEGVIATVASLLVLRELDPDLLLPSHGEPIEEPELEMRLLLERLGELLSLRGDSSHLWSQRGAEEEPQGDPLRLRELAARPYEALSPHLLVNRTSAANSHVLVSETGAALFFDFGFDFAVWPDAAGWDRAKMRPSLYSLPALKREHGVERVEVVIPTHYHDDHVAGIPILQRVEGTEVWCPARFAEIIAEPDEFDLPCLWFDRIAADRVLADGETVAWREFELEVFPLPGHTHWEVAIGFVVDGQRVLVSGDQWSGGDLRRMPYVYKGGFRRGDYARAAELIASFEPDLILSGHEPPVRPAPDLAAQLSERGERLEQLHDALLGDAIEARVPRFARLRPYHSALREPGGLRLTLELESPFDRDREVTAELRMPSGWTAAPARAGATLPGGGATSIEYAIEVPAVPDRARREIVTADLSIDAEPLGELVEAVVTVGPPA